MDNYCSPNDQCGTRERLRVLTVQITVPETWASHLATKVKDACNPYGLGEARVHVGTLGDEHWKRAEYELQGEAGRFTFGEWVTLRPLCTPADSMVPEFVPGTVGQVIGYRAGHAQPWLVAIPTPAKEVDGTEWCYDADPDRRFLRFYYGNHDLVPVTSKDQIPKGFRKNARLRPPVQPEAVDTLINWWRDSGEHDRMERLMAECDKEEKIHPPAPVFQTSFERAHERCESQAKGEPQ